MKTGANTGQFATGKDPRRGHGKPGRSGRPADEFRESMRKIIESKPVRAAFKKIMENPEHPQWTALYTKAAAYAYGQPAQVVEHTGGVEINVRELRESFASRIDRVVERLGASRIPAELN